MEKIRPLKFARSLRQNQTSAEQKLWGALRKRTLGGYRFNRQVSIGPYVVDFLCKEKSLVIEVDGATHGDVNDVRYDQARTRYLNALGLAVYRVGNVDIYENISGTLDGILQALEQQESKFRRKAPLSPSTFAKASVDRSDSSPNKLGERG